jgi:hypothetical protein
MENISRKCVDRLAVIAKGTNFQQLLGVPEVLAEARLEISSAVFDTLESWSLLDKTQAFVFDTTDSMKFIDHNKVIWKYVYKYILIV